MKLCIENKLTINKLIINTIVLHTLHRYTEHSVIIKRETTQKTENLKCGTGGGKKPNLTMALFQFPPPFQTQF